MRSPSYIVARILKKAQIPGISGSDMHPTAKVGGGSVVSGSSFGRYSYCGYDCAIVDTDIGQFCSIANGVVSGPSGNHPLHHVSTSPVFLSYRIGIREKLANHHYRVSKRTLIGNDVWIGERVLIRDGVTVGDGAVLGMGSVVTKDVEPYSIVAGSPARHIRFRFDADVREALLASQWWDYDDDRLREVAGSFDDPIAFLKLIEKS